MAEPETPQPNDQAERPRRRRFRPFRWLGWTLAVVLALLIGAGVAGYAYLQTESGRQTLAGTVERLVSDPEGVVLTIGAIGPGLPTRLLVEDVTLADPDGLWLTVRRAELDWSPRALFRRQVRITEVAADDIHLMRLPTVPAPAEPEPTPPEPTTFELPALPVSVRVDSIAVNDFALGEAVAGEAMVLDLTGRLAAPVDESMQSELRLVRTDAPGTVATLVADYDRSTDHLRLDLDVVEPAGGLIVRLAGLEPYPEARVSLSGAGPLSDWQGTLEAEIGALVDADANINIRRTDGLVATIDGRARVSGLVEPPVRALVEDTVVFSAAVERAPDGVIAIRKLDAESAAVAISGTGRLDPAADAVDASLAVRALDPARWQGLTAPATFDALDLQARITGTLAMPELVLTGSLTELVVPDVLTAAAVDLEATVQPASDDTALGQGPLAIAATVDGRDVVVAEPALAGLTGPRLQLTADGMLDPASMDLDPIAISVESGPSRLAASGRINLGDGSIDAVVDADIGDLTALGDALEQPLAGAVTLSIGAQGNVFDATLAGPIDGAVSDLSLADPAQDALLGGRLTLDGRYDLTAGETLSLEAALSAATPLSLTATASLTDGLQMVDARYRLDVGDLALASDLAGTELGGSLRVEGTAEGPIADPVVAATATLDQARFDTVSVPQATLTASASRVATAPTGTLALRATTDLGPVTADVAFAMPTPERLTLREIALTLPAVRADGALVALLDQGLVDGQITVRVRGEPAGTDLAGIRIAGSADADVRLVPERGTQTVRLDLSAERFAAVIDATRLSIGRLAATARVGDAFGTPQLQVQMEASDVGTAEFMAASVAATLDGPLTDAAFTLTLDEAGAPPLSADAAGRLALTDAATQVRLDRLDGTIDDIPLRLERPAMVAVAGPEISVRDLVLAIADGRIRADGRFGGAATAATIRIESLPVSLAELVMPGARLRGRIDAVANLRTDRGLLAGDLDLRASGIAQERRRIRDPDPLSAVVTATWRGGRVVADARVEGLGTTALTLDASIPLAVDAGTLSPLPRPNQPIAARAQWQGDVAQIWDFLPLAEHSLAGTGRIDLTVAGTLANPEVTGDVTIREGTYEHLIFGTLIRNLDASVSVPDGRTVQISLTGTDGATGRIRADGSARLDDLATSPIEVSLQVRNAILVRRDDVTASASADITFRGTPTEGQLSGRLQTERVEARLIDRMPPTVVTIDVIEIHDDGDVPAPTEPEGPGVPSAITLDLTLEFPGRVFVRGRGLDSEWAGSFRVTGTADAPVVVGSLDVVRGQFNFATRRFDLTRGSISLAGEREIDPRLDIVATFVGPDITAFVNIGGTATQPSVSFSSQPALPESEILPRVLFGKAARELTAAEAVELALALDTLARGDGVVEGILGRVRGAFGIDVLALEPGEDAAAPGVRVGRYIGDRIFVETVVPTGAGGPTFRAEVELTDDLSALGEFTQDPDDTREFFGLKWERRY
ncbi:MAG: hypothetical protein EA405_05415 [Rhodospirillales bacterium]|nr:MAG: hypothetical protein EA405_05415 [Rhodospirillales bacterium]